MKGFPFSLKISALDRFSKTFANVGSKIDRLGKKVNRFGKSVRDVGQSFTVGLTAPIVGFGALSLKSAADVEQMTIALEGLAGGAEGARNLMQELLKFSASTPFQIDGIADSARMLLATEKVSVSELQDMLRVTGDIAAGSKSQINEIAYVMSKAAAKGRADMELLNMFLERGIPIMGALQRQTGTNQQQLEKMVSQGKIGFDILLKAARTLREEGGVYENMMLKQSKSMKGLISTLKDNFNVGTSVFGEAIAQSTKFQERVTSITEKIQKLTEWFKKLSPETQGWIIDLGIIAALVGPVLVGLGQFAIGVAILIKLVGGLTAVIGGLKLLLAAGPWVLFAGLIAGIVYQFVKLVDQVGGVKNALKLVGLAFVDLVLWPIRKVVAAITEVWSLFGSPPAFLKKFAEGSFTRSAADSMHAAKATEAREVMQNSQSLYDLQNRAMKGDPTAIEILFKNAPEGMRTKVSKSDNAEVTVDQGISMQGAF